MYREKILSKLLLDEEGAQMRQLPDAGDTENNELDKCPANDARVCVFGLVAEFGFALLLDSLALCFLHIYKPPPRLRPRGYGSQTYSLENLFPPNVV